MVIGWIIDILLINKLIFRKLAITGLLLAKLISGNLVVEKFTSDSLIGGHCLR